MAHLGRYAYKRASLADRLNYGITKFRRAHHRRSL